MSRPKKSQESPGDPGARIRLLKAAVELFTTKGYAATTVRQIVELAGVSAPVLYYYFKNKEGLYLQLISEPFARQQEFYNRAGTGEGSPVARIFVLCDELFELFMETIDVGRLMMSVYFGPPQGAPNFKFDEQCQEITNVFANLVKEAIAAGEINEGDPKQIAWAIGSIINAVYLEQMSPQPQMDKAGMRQVLGLLFTGVGGSK